MMLHFEKIVAVAVLTVGLAGCEMDQALMGASGTPQPAVSVTPADTVKHYAAVVDAGLNVPAVPVEKVPADFQRQVVDYPSSQPAGTIIIDPSTKHLYLVSGNNKALRYGIAVGRAGFGWSGEADIVGRTTWPKWIPPHEMIDRRPELEKYRDVGQPGGLTNPLGARALYLKTNGVDYGYRIHGTPEWESIGHNASSGCIRMLNQDVMDLYNRVPDGTHVVVLTEEGKFPTALHVPPKPAPKKPAPEVTEIAAAATTATPAPSVSLLPSVTGTAAPAVAVGTTPATATAPELGAPAAVVTPVTVAPSATLPTVVAPAAPTAAASAQPTVPVAPCAEALVNGACPLPKVTP